MSYNCLGLILAGGSSRRMGRDKALLPFGNKATLFEYVLHRFERQIDDIIISTPSQNPVFADCGHDIICDISPFVGLGPLCGLYAAFDYCQKKQKIASLYQAVITIAVDTPFFPDDYVARLCDACAYTDCALIATTHHRQHPTFALWPLPMVQALQHHLETGNTSILSFGDHVGAQPVLFPDENCFFNMNTREEWKLAYNKQLMLKTTNGKRRD